MNTASMAAIEQCKLLATKAEIHECLNQVIESNNKLGGIILIPLLVFFVVAGVCMWGDLR